MKWYAKAFEHADASLEFINRNNLAADDFKMCAFQATRGVTIILIYYRADGPLE